MVYRGHLTHYNHTNLVRGVTRWKIDTPERLLSVRDFDTLEEMNELMIKNINTAVHENDVLIHLGDWSFGGFEKIEEFREKINCKNIILILGNHDHHILRNTNNIRRLFSKVEKYEELYCSENKFGENFVLSHYPIISWNGLNKGSFMLHGHQHLKHEARFGDGKRMDVGICGSPEFRPYNMTEVISLLSSRVSKEPNHKDNV